MRPTLGFLFLSLSLIKNAQSIPLLVLMYEFLTTHLTRYVFYSTFRYFSCDFSTNYSWDFLGSTKQYSCSAKIGLKFLLGICVSKTYKSHTLGLTCFSSLVLIILSSPLSFMIRFTDPTFAISNLISFNWQGTECYYQLRLHVYRLMLHDCFPLDLSQGRY
uniref:Uncharacterized protein n=1 Tax=Opuntia streptacantha TaxID=393608 RepID=A0A7C9A717_OPUST